MIEALGYEFFRNALAAGLLASVACGVIGTYVVVKQMVSISGGISHAAFGGIGLGYYLGIHPLAGAMGFTLAVSALMGLISLRARQHLDTLIGVIWAAGMALGVLFIYLTPGFAPDLMGYLFGNILLVSQFDIQLMGILVIVIIIAVTILYRQFLAVTFDEEFATVMNLPVGRLMILLLLLVGCAVVILIQIVGIILVIALLTLPAAIGREFTSSVNHMMVASVLLGTLFTLSGIIVSFLADIPSGATIILISTSAYGVVVAFKGFNGWRTV